VVWRYAGRRFLRMIIWFAIAVIGCDDETATGASVAATDPAPRNRRPFSYCFGNRAFNAGVTATMSPLGKVDDGKIVLNPPANCSMSPAR